MGFDIVWEEEVAAFYNGFQGARIITLTGPFGVRPQMWLGPSLGHYKRYMNQFQLEVWDLSRATYDRMA